MSGPHAAYRVPNRPAGFLNPDGTQHHELDYTPQPNRRGKHRDGRTYPWNKQTHRRVDRIVRKLIQSRKTETINRNAGLS